MADPQLQLSDELQTPADSDTLALLGKKQVLKRRFGFWSIFGFAVSELVTWETVLALFSQALNNGGPAGLVFGFIIAWLSTLSVYTVISELTSIAPIASGQYHWVYMLAPPKYKKISSYVIGWLTSLAWIATVATECLLAGTMLQGILILRYPDYDATRWQGTLLTWAVISVGAAVNAIVPGVLPKFEIMIMVLHVAGFIAILVTLLTTTHPLGSASTVFLTAFNRGGWSTQGLSYCVGFLGNVATFVGADASVHLAEEVSDAARNIPRAICLGMVANGLIGLAMMITVLFCLGDAKLVLESKTGYPFIQVFHDSVQSVGGAVAMSVIVFVLTTACSTGITTTASRMTWSFARDKGFPYSGLFSKVDKRTRVPVAAVCAVAILAALLNLIYIGSSTAFNDVLSLTITGFYGSYFLPCAFLLYHRIKSNVLPRQRTLDKTNHEASIAIDHELSGKGGDMPVVPANIEEPITQLSWGPWHIPGILGTLNNIYACLYMIFVIFWSVWPPVSPVSANTMNYSIVVTGGVMILSAIWYMARGRKFYRGPIVDDAVAPIVRRGGSIGSIGAFPTPQ